MDEHPKFDEVAAAEEILVELRRRRQRLQLREAKQGDNTDPEVIGEIEDLTTRIIAQESEVRRLKTQAAVDQWSYAEAKYRELLAETWDTARGSPTTVGVECAERVRLELGLGRDRAQELERDIRTKLARETFYGINRWLLANFDETLSAMIASGWDNALPEDENVPSLHLLRLLGKAIRLDTNIAGSLFLNVFGGPITLDREAFGKVLMIANNVWFDWEEKILFQRFLGCLPEKPPS